MTFLRGILSSSSGSDLTAAQRGLDMHELAHERPDQTNEINLVKERRYESLVDKW